MKLDLEKALMKRMQTIFFLIGLFFIKAIQETHSEIASDEAEEYNIKLSSFLKDVLENIRQDMSEAVPGTDVPSLDPLFLDDHHPITLHEGDKFYDMVDLNLLVSDLSIRGISKFHIEKLKVDVRKGSFNLSMSLPELIANGHYNLQGKVMEMFPVRNDGPFTFHLKDVLIEGYSHLIMPNGKNSNVHVDDLYLDLTFKSMDTDFPNLTGNGRYSKWLHKILARIGKRLFTYFHKEAMREVSKELRKAINQEFDSGTLYDLLMG